MFTVYIIKCADGTYYTGQTNNIERRFSEHLRGRCSYTAKHKAKQIVYTTELPTRRHARDVEKKIKHAGAARWLRQNVLFNQHANIISMVC